MGCTMIQNPALPHYYEIHVVDLESNPIEGVLVEYKIVSDDRYEFGTEIKNGKIVKSDTQLTNNSGVIRDSILLKPNFNRYYALSRVIYTISKEGYYPQKGVLNLDLDYFGKHTLNSLMKKDTIILIRPVEYFNNELTTTISNTELESSLYSFIDSIILHSFESRPISLQISSIGLIKFKDESYLTIILHDNMGYFATEHDRYDIGKLVFDEVIRKVLNQIDDCIHESTMFSGYSITVFEKWIEHPLKYKNGEYTWGFRENIEYRFMIPQNVAKDYRNKEVTGQQVLDNSIFLLNDERIELILH